MACQSEMSLLFLFASGRWPISSLAVDRLYFYWTDIKERRVHKVRRLESVIDQAETSSVLGPISALKGRSEVLVELANVYKVVTFGTNFQPLPSQSKIFQIIISVDLPFIFKRKILNALHRVMSPTLCDLLTIRTIALHY